MLFFLNTVITFSAGKKMVKTSFSNDSTKKGKKCYHEKCTVSTNKKMIWQHMRFV